MAMVWQSKFAEIGNKAKQLVLLSTRRQWNVGYWLSVRCLIHPLHGELHECAAKETACAVASKLPVPIGIVRVLYQCSCFGPDPDEHWLQASSGRWSYDLCGFQ